MCLEEFRIERKSSFRAGRIIRAGIVAAALCIFASSSAVAQEVAESVECDTVAKPAAPKSYGEIKKMLSDYKAKVEKSTKDDSFDLLVEGWAIKKDIEAANLSDDEMAEVKEEFNAIIEICKSLK